MTRADTGLRFWLRYVQDAGGLCEDTGDSAVAVLPEAMQRAYRQPEEMVVTADPDVARDDGAVLLLAGHPLLMHAAEAVLHDGDCGVVRLPRPPGLPPGTDQLLAAARDQFPVDHGRIDARGGASPAVRPVLRVGALVSFGLSSDAQFQEQAEFWIDVPSCLELPEPVVARLPALMNEPGEGLRPPLAKQLQAAVQRAHEQMDRRAGERRAELSTQIGDEQSRETERAVAYYAEALASLERRLDSATPERAQTLLARMSSTHAERDRRLAEITEKYRATHTIRPFRLHVIGVPVLQLPVDVRRGDRRYPLVLDWMLSPRTFAGVRCPSCHSTAPLVAAKTRLGCRQCLAKPGPRPEQPQKPPPVREHPAPESASHHPPLDGAARPSAREAPRPRDTIAEPARVRSPQAIQKAGRKLAASLWDLAAAGDRRVSRLYAPGSPAAAAHELFGPAAPRLAIGLDIGEPPLSVTSSDSAPSPDGSDMLLVDGELHTAGWGYPYQLCWRFTGGAALIEELTPFAGAHWPRLPQPRYLPFSPAARRLYDAAPRPQADLDQVARVLWRRAVPVHGLPLVLRCLAAWWRVADRDELLQAHPADAIAAAIDRMVAYRAGASGRHDDAAAAYQVSAAAVRAVTADLQRRLRLSATCPW
jgi:hypothetical protein